MRTLLLITTVALLPGAGCGGEPEGAADGPGPRWTADGAVATDGGALPDTGSATDGAVAADGQLPPPDGPPPPAGPVAPPVTDPYPSEADTPSKCAFDPMQWWAGPTKRDVTFVVFGDPHAADPAPGCPANKSYAQDQNDLMRAALNSTDAAPHVWPAGPGFYREGAVYDHVRGVLIAGDLTHVGSDAVPVGTQLGHDCREYTAYRGFFGRCGDEGKLKFPVYEAYGNHDFPVVIGSGDPAYHPVVEYLDALTALRPGAAADLYEDPKGHTGHLAWRWDDIWFVNVDLKPGDANEVIPKGANTRIAVPHASRQFLQDFLASRSNSAKRQIVMMSHYGLDSSRIEPAEKTALCKLLNQARNGSGPFAGQKLAAAHPVAAYLHGHSHDAPHYKSWTCPSPYAAITIPMFDTGTPLYKSGNNGGKLHFTILRLGTTNVEAVGAGAPATSPTGAWSYTYKKRLKILVPPG